MSYALVRFYGEDDSRVLRRGLTLKQVEAHCRSDKASYRTATTWHGLARTKKYGRWFDGYTKESCQTGYREQDRDLTQDLRIRAELIARLAVDSAFYEEQDAGVLISEPPNNERDAKNLALAALRRATKELEEGS
jgi:hypothetical protein